jgi:hypothetical protein
MTKEQEMPAAPQFDVLLRSKHSDGHAAASNIVLAAVAVVLAIFKPGGRRPRRATLPA